MLTNNLIEKSESHIVIGTSFISRFFLLLVFFLGSSGSWGGSSSSWCSWSGSGSNAGDQFLDINTFQCLGEQAWPVWFDLNVSGFQNCGNFFTLQETIELLISISLTSSKTSELFLTITSTIKNLFAVHYFILKVNIFTIY